MVEVKLYSWLTRTFGGLFSLGVLFLSYDVLRRGENPWLIPSIFVGSAMFLSIPSVLFLVWGFIMLKKASPDKVLRIKYSMAFAATPIIISVIGFILGFIFVLISPPGMATR